MKVAKVKHILINNKLSEKEYHFFCEFENLQEYQNVLVLTQYGPQTGVFVGYSDAYHLAEQPVLQIIDIDYKKINVDRKNFKKAYVLYNTLSNISICIESSNTNYDEKVKFAEELEKKSIEYFLKHHLGGE